MKESQVREHLAKGWIRAIVTFEIVGKPKAHIEQALTGYLENIKQDHRIMFLKEDREEAIEHEDGMFSSFCEAELLVQNLDTFNWLCINFSPASVEIIAPDELVIPAREVTNWLNDLLSKVHEIGTNYRSHKAANEHLVIAMNQLIQNIILLTLRTGTKTVKDLERETGILDEQLGPFLKHLAEKGEIDELGGAYALPDPARKIKPKAEVPAKRKKKK
jgi:hypothetical protein